MELHSVSYVWEKLCATVLILAEGLEDLRKRLPDAWFAQLQRLRSDLFPEELRELRSLFAEVEAVLRDSNCVQILEGLSDDEIYGLACKITHLYDLVCCAMKRGT